MINSTNASYSFEDSDRWFGYNHRINITMSSGKVYNVAAEQDLNKFILPKCLSKLFWAKVTLSDADGNNKTFLINRNSLAKRTGTSGSLSKFALKHHKKDFDVAMRVMHTADKIAEGMEKDHSRRSKRMEKAGEVVKIIERNKDKLNTIAAVKGSFIARNKNHTIFVRINPNDPGKTNFYFKQAKLLGKGGFKKVYPLMDYDTQESKFALSVQKIDKKNRKKMDYPLKGFKIMETLKDSKNTMNAELFQEEGIERTPDGTAILASDEAVSYMVTKKYDGKFSNILKADNITSKDKLFLFTKILEAVSDMHAKRVFHGDLNFYNVLYKIKNGICKIKVIDFDLSKSFEERMATRAFSGTDSYIAPEALAMKTIQEPDKIDSWSLGIMLYTLCEGKPAYFSKFGKDKGKWADIALNGARNLPFNKLNDKHPLREVIKGLLNEDPAARMSADEALIAVNAYIARWES